MKLEKPCIPWYFPKNDTSGLRLCNPWEAMDFRKIMDKIPVAYYSHCLTDCSGITYHAKVTAAPFSRCDFKNIGVSDLCNFDVKLSPTIWGESVMDQYKEELEKSSKKMPEEVSEEVIKKPIEDILKEHEQTKKENEDKEGKTIPDYITKGVKTNQRKYTGKPFNISVSYLFLTENIMNEMN